MSIQDAFVFLITVLAAGYSLRYLYKSLTLGEVPSRCAKCALMQKK